MRERFGAALLAPILMVLALLYGARRTLLALAGFALVLAPAAAAASAGCDAINAGALNHTAQFTNGTVDTYTGRELNSGTPINAIYTSGWSGNTVNARWYPGSPYDFANGEVLTFTLTTNVTAGILQLNLGISVNGTTLGTTNYQGSQSFTRTFDGTQSAYQTSLARDATGTGTISIAVTCAGASPTVTSVSPIAGPTGGGTAVTITGTNFTGTTGAAGVKFGAANATGYTVNSSTQITATAPAGAAGTVDITVTNGGNTSATSSADQYTYVAAPTVTAVSPTAGPTAGGTTVVITGTGFSAAPGTGAVKFGASNATYTINSNTQITATSPANSAGTYDITVTTPGGTSATSASDQYTYVAAPTVSSVSPIAGPTGGGTAVTITGANFSGATAVTFGGTAATGYTVMSGTQIIANAPAGAAGTVDIRVTTVGGTSATSANDQYTYVAAPTVTAVSPTAGPTAGGATVVITGTGFSAAPGTGAVRFGASNATYTINSNTQITATSPANSAGTYDITVTTPGGTSATSASD
ncbi:hypothetical protein HNP52_000001, partial [Sphingomonas kyeonggiensis]